MEYIDAEVTAITTSHALTPDVHVRQLIHTEQHRILKERSGLLVRHPEAKILFSRPTGYGQRVVFEPTGLRGVMLRS